MKCTYRFTVKGFLKPYCLRPIRVENRIFEFEVQDNLVTHITVTIPLPNRSDWPQMIPVLDQRIKADLNIKTPHLEEIEKEVRTLEGLLSLYGVLGIDVLYPEIEWTPENKEEEKQLLVSRFKRSRGVTKAEDLHRDPFDLLARSVLAANQASEIQIPLSFYRKGMLDLAEQRYIEAIYNFYFLLESVFGQGKTKNYAVEESLIASSVLKRCIEVALARPEVVLGRNPHLEHDFVKRFHGRTAEEVIRHVVKLRGFLHHHQSNRKDIWHPGVQHEFKLDALVLQQIAFHVAFGLAERFVFDPKVISSFQMLFADDKDLLTGPPEWA